VIQEALENAWVTLIAILHNDTTAINLEKLGLKQPAIFYKPLKYGVMPTQWG